MLEYEKFCTFDTNISILLFTMGSGTTYKIIEYKKTALTHWLFSCFKKATTLIGIPLSTSQLALFTKSVYLHLILFQNVVRSFFDRKKSISWRRCVLSSFNILFYQIVNCICICFHILFLKAIKWKIEIHFDEKPNFSLS